MLKINQLTKKYGKFTALDGFDMEIKAGEFFGFVGPNGAGKTTTMKIISGLLMPDKGEVYVDGLNIYEEESKIKEKIGYMPDFFGIYDNLKVIEYMEFYASIYGIEGLEAKERCNELLEMLGLIEKSDLYVDGLSRGMKQKLCLARCLVHNPPMLILDEPASGLDPMARKEMKNILKTLNNAGKTIMISSHILSELCEMCSNIGIIESGKMILNGTVDKIMSTLKNSNPILVRIIENREVAVNILKENPYVKNMTIQGELFSVNFKGNEQEEANLLKSLITNDVVVLSYNRREGNLEDLFIKITGQEAEKHA